jgi:hypothetical protein
VCHPTGSAALTSRRLGVVDEVGHRVAALCLHVVAAARELARRLSARACEFGILFAPNRRMRTNISLSEGVERISSYLPVEGLRWGAPL